jgi:ComF family protein
VFDELLNLLLPTNCAICKRIGAPVCPTCAEIFPAAPRSTWRGNLKGLAVCDYGDQSIKLIRAFKEVGQTSVGKFIAPQMGALLAGWTGHLVAVPSSRANLIKRGYSPALLLTRRVAKAAGMPMIGALRFSRAVADQAGLGIDARRQNLEGSMVAGSEVSGKQVILVDDVVTTGATLHEAARAVTLAGGEVVGFITFAETLLKIDHEYLKTRTKNSKWV